MSYNAYNNYLCQMALAEGHKRFGPADPRKEDDEGGDGSGSYQPEGNAIPPHPLLAKAAQFSGDDKLETPLVQENEEAQKDYDLQLAHQHQKKLEKSHQHRSTPTPTP